jgi:hypothetical protein
VRSGTAGREPLLVDADRPAGLELFGEGVEVGLFPIPHHRGPDAAGQHIVPWWGFELDAVDADDPRMIVLGGQADRSGGPDREGDPGDQRVGSLAFPSSVAVPVVAR